MQEPQWDLTQLNIGTIVALLDSEELAGFVDALEAINASADAAPGFRCGCRTTPVRGG